MKKISHLTLIIILVSFVLPNISHADLIKPWTWDWTDKCSGFFNPQCAGSVGQTGVQSGVALSSSGNIYQSGLGIAGLIVWILNILRLIFPVIVSAAIVYFVWNVFQYTIYDTEKDKKEVRDKLVWGIVAIFIMMSVWGLVNILQSTFRLDNRTIRAPGIQTSL